MPSYQPTQFILDEDDVTEDPFKDKRATMKLAPGEVPSMTYTEPGMTITTVEVPALGEAKMWHNFLHQLQTASGMVVTRGLGQIMWDKDIYLYMQDMLSEVCEVADARPMFMVNIAKGDIRSLMMTLPAISDICLAEPDATFGFPEVRLGGLPAIQSAALRKRLSDDSIRRLITTGDVIDAREAQRIGLVDFVGDVETELARLIFRNCQPQVTKIMYKPDCEKAWKAQK
mmetsp:Transcript_110710/g.313209  ORF Transcript_110710/g.313209 Transcript_110710/m.313209 type:complete len:229 (-) Transcript_110710:164-850(-)